MPILPKLARSDAEELLDQPIADIDALADNLRDLRAIDRYLNGTALTWRYLLPMLHQRPRGTPVTLLDVATGGADGPRRIARLAQLHGYDLRPIASDRLLEVLRFARSSGVDFPLIQHDALAIPLRSGAVDFVTCSLALHHFDMDAAVALLCELTRVARYGVIVNDLRRSRVAYLGARLLALGPWHAMARHDGPLSVLRAYTLAEVQTLTERAGMTNALVEAQAPFRVVVVIREV